MKIENTAWKCLLGFAICVSIFVILAFLVGERTSPPPEVEEPAPVVVEEKEERITEWRMIEIVKKGEPVRYGAISPTTNASETLAPPDSNREVHILITCDEAYLIFDEMPRLVFSAKREVMSTSFVTHGYVDGEFTGRWRVSQPWGSKSVSFDKNSSAVISAILDAEREFSIGTLWWGGISVEFVWELNGAPEMIQQSCETN